MSEIGPGISEIRPTREPSQGNNRNQVHPSSFPTEPGSEVPKTWKDRVKSLALKMSGEQEFKPQDYEIPVISKDLLDRAGNRMRGGINQQGNMPTRFDIRDLLTIKGQVRAMGNPNSDAYRAATQALNTLVREGALQVEELPEEFHGVFRRYYIVDPQKLQELTKPQEEE